MTTEVRPFSQTYAVSEAVLGITGTGLRLIGEANEGVDKHALKATKQNIDMSGKNRWEKFSNTFTGCIEGGSQGGALFGDVAMAVPDFLLGRGTKDPARYNTESEGLVGLVAHGAIDGVSTVAMVPGAIAGGAVGLLVCQPANGMDEGAALAGSTTSAALSIPTGIALGAARLPSLIVKGAITVVGGIIGGVVGFVGGLGRALFNI